MNSTENKHSSKWFIITWFLLIITWNQSIYYNTFNSNLELQLELRFSDNSPNRFHHPLRLHFPLLHSLHPLHSLRLHYYEQFRLEYFLYLLYQNRKLKYPLIHLYRSKRHNTYKN